MGKLMRMPGQAPEPAPLPAEDPNEPRINLRLTLLQASIIYNNPELCRALRMQRCERTLLLTRTQLEVLKHWAERTWENNDNRRYQRSDNGYLRVTAESILNKVNAALEVL